MKFKTLRINKLLSYERSELFSLLTNSEKLSKIVDQNCYIDGIINHDYYLFSGSCGGTILEVKNNYRLVMSFISLNKIFSNGNFSKLVFEIDVIENKTSLNLIQSDVPMEHYEEIKNWWNINLFEKLK